MAVGHAPDIRVHPRERRRGRHSECPAHQGLLDSQLAPEHVHAAHDCKLHRPRAHVHPRAAHRDSSGHVSTLGSLPCRPARQLDSSFSDIRLQASRCYGRLGCHHRLRSTGPGSHFLGTWTAVLYFSSQGWIQQAAEAALES
jgi:hypothetical protein